MLSEQYPKSHSGFSYPDPTKCILQICHLLIITTQRLSHNPTFQANNKNCHIPKGLEKNPDFKQYIDAVSRYLTKFFEGSIWNHR